MTPLPDPPSEYSAAFQSELNNAIREIEDNSLKLNEDNFVDTGSLVIKSPNGKLWRLSVNDTGDIISSQTTTNEDGTLSARGSNPYGSDSGTYTVPSHVWVKLKQVVCDSTSTQCSRTSKWIQY